MEFKKLKRSFLLPTGWLGGQNDDPSNEKSNGRPLPPVVEAAKPRPLEMILLRLLIIAGSLLVLFFIAWFTHESVAGYLPLYVLLCISLTYKLLKLCFEWYHYWSIGLSRRPRSVKQPTADIFTTAMPGEPFDMIKKTLVAMQQVRYPHTSYLCDEGNDPTLIELCKKLGVVHITREHKIDAKAGNINNALQYATGEICVILDPDHAPLPEFLDEVIPYFDKPDIGFVQVVQAYNNAACSFIALGAAQQTYIFYGPLMMGMNTYGTVQAIGANCSFRRAALDSIGGHAAGLAEDMHTAMQLHAKGWKSVYLPKILTRGLVPANINSYYKQQLKWSRGTLELLFTVFPKLCTKFGWRQLLHYFLLPLHFAAGLIILIDILIPVISLLSGEVPLYFTVSEFYQAGVPLLFITLLIRQFAQRWLLEKNEHGFHLAGGILLFGTWWIYCVGLFYTLFRVKVPYLATPKHEEYINNWKLQIPNIIALALSVIAAIYGLSRDWNPYNFVTAGFALLNAIILGMVVISSQQRLLHATKLKLWNTPRINSPFYAVKHSLVKPLPAVYALLRNNAPLLVFMVIFASAISFRTANNNTVLKKENRQKNDGGFYSGVYIPAVQQQHSLTAVSAFEKAIDAPANIISLYQAWGPASLEQFPGALLEKINAQGSIPMITWEPWVSLFAPQPGWPQLQREQKAMAAIAAGVLDEYIHAYAKKIRDYHKPIFIRFAHEADNPAYPWSTTGNNTAEEYKAAWQKLVAMFAADGVSNVTWVWTPWQRSTAKTYYPGDGIIDWIGITCLNYGAASWDGKWRSFEEIYEPYKRALLPFKKPIMLAEFGSTNYGGDANQWLSDAIERIHNNHKEIKSLVFFNNPEDKNWITAWRPSRDIKGIDWQITKPPPLRRLLSTTEQPASHHFVDGTTTATHVSSTIIGKSSGRFEWMVSGKPFYVKGIAYNPAHDWRDGYYPLTRKQLEKDFLDIKATGCNTILRYNPSVYDRNIINIAQENDLKILYGFWFDPKVDYYKDSIQVKKYYTLVAETVKSYKDKPAILAWCLGNQGGSDLRNHFSSPYLQVVQQSYMRMIESMARLIHTVDDKRPVVASLQYSWLLPGELRNWNNEVPSVDIIGINTAYTQHIDSLPELIKQSGNTRPYLVTSFGANGYWDEKYNSFDMNHNLHELNDDQKAALYSNEWNQQIYPGKGYNLGGVAFCWKDRFDGSATWSGITDFKGRKKSAYYALQQAWTDRPSRITSPGLFLVGPSYPLKPDMNYEFTAVYQNAIFNKVEWHLYRDDYTSCDKYISLTGNHYKTWVSLPPGPASYRLYIYVSDNNGNVVTSSIPLTTYTGVYNHDL
jgi:cellulose synthase (UDP-forming)